MDKKITIVAAIAVILMLFGCKSVQYVPVKEVHTDTITVEKHDTVRITQHPEKVSVPLPVVVMKNSTKDTVSVLKDGLYKSTASIKDGVLKHTLETLPGAKVDGTAQVTDTARVKYIYKNEKKADQKPIYVEKQLTTMQKLFIDVGKVACAMIALLLAYAIAKLVIYIRKKVML